MEGVLRTIGYHLASIGVMDQQIRCDGQKLSANW
jgi:hypothetical protein